MAPKVTIVILNWNGRADTIECLESIRAINYPDFEIIVVDNGSSDGSVGAISREFPECDVIETGSNLGYAGGNNCGIRRALKKKADYILILNNDVIVDPAILSSLVGEAESRPDGGIWGAKVISYDDPRVIHYAGSVEDRRGAAYGFIGHGELDDGVSYQDLVETAFVHGAAFLIRSAVIREAGMMDERFFLYYEETEWCSRIREKGYKLYYVPTAQVRHKNGKSTGGAGSPLQIYFLARNHLLWAEMHMPLSSWIRLFFRFGRSVLFPLSEIRLRDLLIDQKRFYWATWTWMQRAYLQWREPTHWAHALGFRDYLLRRLGDCPNCVRRWNEASRS